MKTPLLLLALSTVMLAACTQADSPTAPGVRPLTPRRSEYSVLSAEAIAYEVCDFLQEGYTGCDLKVRNSDGSEIIVTERDFATGDESQTREISWSPDGTQLAYDAGFATTDILVARVIGGALAKLTDNPAEDASPAWSPDGSRIAFVSTRDNKTALYLMNASDGGNVTLVVPDVMVGGNIQWSPDGSHLIFSCEIDPDTSDICSVKSDGTSRVRLTSGGGYHYDPAYSPDGTRIAFSINFTIFTMNADGTDPKTLASAQGRQPSWSPDGLRIMFSGMCPDSWASCLFIINTDGSNLVDLGPGSAGVFRPAINVAALPPDAPPVAQISASCEYLECSFSSSQSSDDRGIASRSWNFGDGSQGGEGLAAQHTYAAGGTYTVTLTVTDISGQSGTATQSLNFVPPNQLPIVAFSYACVKGACTFDSSASTDDVGITSRRWYFGNVGIAFEVVAPSFTFLDNGVYSVTLQLYDNSGYASTLTKQVTVTGIDHPPVAHFYYSCKKSTCTFDGRSSTDDFGIVSYSWKLGTVMAAGSVVTTSFKPRSTQDVTLTVTDASGQRSSMTATVVMTPP